MQSKMKITLEGLGRCPKWTDLQNLIRSTIEPDGDSKAKIVTIQRVDGGCDYRARGVYSLQVQTDSDDLTFVRFEVK